MDSNSLLLILGGAAIVGALYYFINKTPKEPVAQNASQVTASEGLRLQAYERLTLLVDRISIPNLISRTSHDGLTARDLQFILTKSIREEFEYNITQQIYVSAEVWNAVRNLKEKNLLLINQAAAALPAGASGIDMSRRLLDSLMNDKAASLPELVSEALSFEAKKLL